MQGAVRWKNNGDLWKKVQRTLFQTDIRDGSSEEVHREAKTRRCDNSICGECVGQGKVFTIGTRILMEQKAEGEHKHPEGTKELLICALF